MTNNPNDLTIENSALRKVSSVARTTTIIRAGTCVPRTPSFQDSLMDKV